MPKNVRHKDMKEIYPLKFRPIYKDKIWGGRNLARLFGRVLPADKKIGESWELADLPEGVSSVANGPRQGQCLTDLLADWSEDLLGTAKPMPDRRFPLLVKFLDAEDILSLQVHPDVQAVSEIGPTAAVKTECWYVVESRGGVIYKGVKSGVGPDQFRQAIASDNVETVVRRIDVSTGDFHYLPAGTVHAVGPGLVIAEVQTPSDTTYRVTDWGRGRQLHIDRSMQCIRFGLTDSQPGASGQTLLVTEHFTVARRTIPSGQELSIHSGHCSALMALGGRGAIVHAGAGANATEFAAGDTLVIPAALKRPRVLADSILTFLEIGIGEQG